MASLNIWGDTRIRILRNQKISVTIEKKTPQAKNWATLILQEKINKKLNTKQVESVTFEKIYNLFYKSWA
ncbi:hypothetical protein [Streptococcus oralis]|uniref:hypothetical protein n=1 Tax=Streptococcus oralis TaxID=1303 RepID=UPI001EFEEDF0|nr:hypothetical protein [Streptococcus oralis]